MAGKKALLMVVALFVVSQAQAADLIENVSVGYTWPTGSAGVAGSPQGLVDGNLLLGYRMPLMPRPCELPAGRQDVYTFTFTFDEAYSLDSINIWNSWITYGASEGRTYDGAKNIDIYVSPTLDPAGYGSPYPVELTRTNNGGDAKGLTPEQAYANGGLNVIDMKGVEARMVMIVIKDNWSAVWRFHEDSVRHPNGPEWEFFPFGFDDRTVGINNVAFFTIVPEPATMSLLALGGLAMLRRRR